MGMQFQLEGVQPLINRLMQLEKKVRRKGLRRAMAASNKVVLPVMKETARAEVHSQTGALVKSLGQKISLPRDAKRVVGIVGPRKGQSYVVSRMKGEGAKPVLNRRGEQLVRQPTRYAHLAGPRRKSTFVQDADRQTRAARLHAMADSLRETLAEA